MPTEFQVPCRATSMGLFPCSHLSGMLQTRYTCKANFTGVYTGSEVCGLLGVTDSVGKSKRAGFQNPRQEALNTLFDFLKKNFFLTSFSLGKIK